MEFHDDFDSRLATAVRPIVTETVPVEAVLAGEGLERRGGVSLAPVAAIAAIVVVGAAAVAVPRLAGPASVAPPVASPAFDEASLAAVPHVRTSDGIVLVERAGGDLRLVLVRGNGDRLVLESHAEKAPAADTSSSSLTPVVCPAATGLKQTYYAFGQANHVTGSTISYEGMTGVGAIRDGMYVIAITSDPTKTDWRFSLGSGGLAGGGGGAAGAFDVTLKTGTRSEAGCFS